MGGVEALHGPGLWGGVVFLSKTSQFRAEKRHILTKISQNTIYCPQFGLRISELIAFNCSNKNT